MEFRADLHIHTLLSGCAELEMLPGLILAAAQMANIDLIAICDHNSAENAGAVIRASQNTSVRVLPGLEVQTLEGIHVLCIFNELADALKLQEMVYESLPDVVLPDSRAQEQIVADENDDFVEFCRRPVSMPANIDLERVCSVVQRLEGVTIPSHVDKHGTGLLDVLGYLPEDSHFDAFELSANITSDQARQLYPDLVDKTLVSSSDAHWLSAIGERHTLLEMRHRNLDELRLALHGENGRRAYVA